jgi:hypothetical protein
VHHPRSLRIPSQDLARDSDAPAAKVSIDSSRVTVPLFAGQNREQLRRMYLEAWRKYSARLPLEPLEAQLAAVIAEHPEYIPLLESGAEALSVDFTPAGGRENPFLHMGLHLAIREQVATDRPSGITQIHAELSKRLGDSHAAEHAMLEPLAETLWQAQRSGRMPDERRYLERLRAL